MQWREDVCRLVAQSCVTLCNPMNCSPWGSSIHEILQARILEWIAIPFSRGSSWPRDCTQVSCIAGRFFTICVTEKAHANSKLLIYPFLPLLLGFPGDSGLKTLPANAGDMGLSLGLGRSSGEGNGHPLQYSCLENSVDRGAWWATVHGVAKRQTQLND